MNLELVELPRRNVAVVRHRGPLETMEETRRPLYQHLIMEELIGGPAMARFPLDEAHVDLLVVTHEDFHGDDVANVEALPAGTYARTEWEGPTEELPAARKAFVHAVEDFHGEHDGHLLQVHLMDPIDGITEQAFEIRLRDDDA